MTSIWVRRHDQPTVGIASSLLLLERIHWKAWTQNDSAPKKCRAWLRKPRVAGGFGAATTVVDALKDGWLELHQKLVLGVP